jgi:hypothetical protein
MVDQEKLTAVREYLRKEFAGFTIEDWSESGQKAHLFRVTGERRVHNASIAEDFLNELETGEVESKLRSFTLAEHLREIPDTPIMVTRNGLKLQHE